MTGFVTTPDDAMELPPLCRIALLAWQETPRPTATEAAQDFGSYDGLPAQVALLPDGRTARLLAGIAYRAADGTAWEVPAGALLDGASIPRLFWTLIGGPFEGRYRDASIVHDRFCVARTRSWQATHRMFHAAMRCSGVGVAQAKVMFYAVFRFGPRWPDPDRAGGAEAAPAPPPAPDDAALRSAAADAEAIYLQDLSLGEIEALADARAATSGEAAASPRLTRARELVIPGGSGTREDLAVVAAEVARLPDYVLRLFERKRIRIVACRGSVTDFERRLRGVVPRGWEGTGRTWDSVPGTYFDDKRRVVIATVAGGAGRIVPTRETRLHGSANLVVHESLHGYDYSLRHGLLAERAFLDARTADHDRLGSYELQPGRPGLEETFAESGARFVAAPEAGDWPHLRAWWQAGAAASGGSGLTTETAPSAASDALGTAEIDRAGVITLDLRAEGEGGAIGHAMLTIDRGDAAYERLRHHLFATESAATGAKVPFRPLPPD